MLPTMHSIGQLNQLKLFTMEIRIKVLLIILWYVLQGSPYAYCSNIYMEQSIDLSPYINPALNTGKDNGTIKLNEKAKNSLKLTLLNNQENDPLNEDLSEDIQRVRISFIASDGFTRFLLLGFTPDNAASDAVDYGYDALNTENFPNDMYWFINGNYYVIQGVGTFDVSKSYPLAIQLSDDAYFEISLNALENFQEPIDVYIYDSELDISFQINDNNYQNKLEAGLYTNRFYLTFVNNFSLSVNEYLNESIEIRFLQKEQQLYITTPDNVFTEEVSLINIVSQSMSSWDVSSKINSQYFPIRNLSDGIYFVRIKTNTGIHTRKLIYTH